LTDWNLSCLDWEDRIRSGRSLIPDLPLFADPARRAVGVYNRLRLPDVPDMPALADAGADWFREIIAALFGSFDAEAGERFIRELFCLVPKKNSKTTNGAALMVTALLLNERPRAEFVLTGPTQEVSDLAFSQAQGMIAADPDGFLQRRMHVQEHLKTITDRRTKAKLKIKTFDASVVTGSKLAGVLIDELHEVAKIKNAANIIGQLRGGMISQPEAFLAFITTQSDDPPVGAFKAELTTARAVRDGKLPGSKMLAVLYEFPRDVVKPARSGETPIWYDTKLWPMVTPNRGKSITVERLAQDFETAKTKGEGEIRRWASQHLNIEIGLALRSDRWTGADYWEGRGDAAVTLDEILAKCEVVVTGIDGGGLDDLLALAVLGRLPGAKPEGGAPDRRKWLLWTRSWVHQKVLELRKSEAAKFTDLAATGDLVIVDVPGSDIMELVAIVERIAESGLLAEKNAVGLDPVGIGQIVDELDGIGINGDRVVGISQGWKMSGAIKTTERKLFDGTLAHGGTELMAWAVSNARVEPKGNAITITKQASGTAKIDPLMAAFDAVALMSMNPESAKSVYADRGIAFV